MPRSSSTNSRANVQKQDKTAPKTDVAQEQATPKIEQPAPVEDAAPAYRVKASDLDPNMYVPVRNGFNGKLIYISRRTGEKFVWEHFGDEQDMELRELRAAKTSYKAFYENNWFLIDDPAVIEYLGVERFYANALSYDEFDSLFTLTPEEIAEKIDKLSKGQRSSLAYSARQLIKDGGIDSIKVINILERSLGIELIEK